MARSLGCEIEFRTPKKGKRQGNVLARITPITYHEIEGSAYIHGATSVYARIERVGGATDMHCGIRLPKTPRKMVICRVVSEDLVRQLGQYMYQYVLLTGDATWLRHNGRLKRLVIKSFEAPRTGSVAEALQKAYSAGGDAWDTIEDPNAYLADMRH